MAALGGVRANFSQRFLTAVPPLTLAAGSCGVILPGSAPGTGLPNAKAQPPRGAAAGAHFACELLRLGAAMAKRG